MRAWNYSSLWKPHKGITSPSACRSGRMAGCFCVCLLCVQENWTPGTDEQRVGRSKITWWQHINHKFPITVPDWRARLSLLKGRKSHPRAAPTFPFSVYLHMSDSSSNITLLTDPSVLLHVLPFKSQASRDNAVYSSNDCVCLNGCATIEFCSFYI